MYTEVYALSKAETYKFESYQTIEKKIKNIKTIKIIMDAFIRRG